MLHDTPEHTHWNTVAGLKSPWGDFKLTKPTRQKQLATEALAADKLLVRFIGALSNFLSFDLVQEVLVDSKMTMLFSLASFTKLFY